MLKKYSKFLDALEKVMKVLLAISLSVMSAVIIYQVVLRYVFSAANAWSEELARYLMIFAVMVASAIALRKNSHLQIDILINRLKPQTKAIFTLVSTIVGIVFLCFLFVYSLGLMKLGQTNLSSGLGIVMAIPYAFIPLGVVLMVLASIEVVFKNLEELRQGKEGGNNS
ncbi:MAG: TRAP transporter small permease [Christensenellales bacterium]|jgi:TRAP-type C4-dicarboxylate transport system permease small subunit